MRGTILLSLLVLGACAEAEAPKAETKAERPAALAAGQWEITSEVTNFSKSDNGTARIDTPVGTRATTSTCIPEAEVKRPPVALFADPSEECTYDSVYVANGRVTASLTCRREGLNGKIMRTASGNYTADSLEGEASLDTYFASDGDVRIGYSLTGRRTGECVAAPADAATNTAAEG